MQKNKKIVQEMKINLQPTFQCKRMTEESHSINILTKFGNFIIAKYCPSLVPSSELLVTCTSTKAAFIEHYM